MLRILGISLILAVGMIVVSWAGNTNTYVRIENSGTRYETVEFLVDWVGGLTIIFS